MTLIHSSSLQVGKLGDFSFPPGDYVYLGSAHGPGGLRARLQRHLRGAAHHAHWHIDYLLEITSVHAISYSIGALKDDLRAPLECLWSQELTDTPGATIPAPGFGASDCRNACRAHLVHFPFPSRQRSSMPRRSFPLEILAGVNGAPVHTLICE